MHVYIPTHQDEDGYPPVAAEELDARELGPGLAEITGIPVFVYGYARGDTVQLEVRRHSRDNPWVVAVASNSDHWTTRVVSLVDEDLGRIGDEFINLGCDAQVTPYGLVAVDVPASVDVDHLLGVLQRGRDQKRWDYDLGVDPHA